VASTVLIAGVLAGMLKAALYVVTSFF